MNNLFPSNRFPSCTLDNLGIAYNNSCIEWLNGDWWLVDKRKRNKSDRLISYIKAQQQQPISFPLNPNMACGNQRAMRFVTYFTKICISLIKASVSFLMLCLNHLTRSGNSGNWLIRTSQRYAPSDWNKNRFLHSLNGDIYPVPWGLIVNWYNTPKKDLNQFFFTLNDYYTVSCSYT